MARIRMIKPEFFDDPDAAGLTPLARLFFIGLWTQADREGRLVDDPRRLAARLFPYEKIDAEALVVELHAKDMVRRYIAVERNGSDVKERGYIWVRNFSKHQRPHPKEPASVIPSCPHGTGKLHGEPRKETASRVKEMSSPSESGFLDTESGTRDLDSGIKAAAAPRPSDSSLENPDDNVGVITKIAHEAINLVGPDHLDLAETVKSLCSIRDIRYDSGVVRKALDSALVQRRVRA